MANLLSLLYWEKINSDAKSSIIKKPTHLVPPPITSSKAQELSLTKGRKSPFPFIYRLYSPVATSSNINIGPRLKSCRIYPTERKKERSSAGDKLSQRIKSIGRQLTVRFLHHHPSARHTDDDCSPNEGLAVLLFVFHLGSLLWALIPIISQYRVEWNSLIPPNVE